MGWLTVAGAALLCVLLAARHSRCQLATPNTSLGTAAGQVDPGTGAFGGPPGGFFPGTAGGAAYPGASALGYDGVSPFFNFPQAGGYGAQGGQPNPQGFFFQQPRQFGGGGGAAPGSGGQAAGQQPAFGRFPGFQGGLGQLGTVGFPPAFGGAGGQAARPDAAAPRQALSPSVPGFYGGFDQYQGGGQGGAQPRAAKDAVETFFSARPFQHGIPGLAGGSPERLFLNTAAARLNNTAVKL